MLLQFVCTSQIYGVECTLTCPFRLWDIVAIHIRQRLRVQCDLESHRDLRVDWDTQSRKRGSQWHLKTRLWFVATADGSSSSHQGNKSSTSPEGFLMNLVAAKSAGRLENVEATDSRGHAKCTRPSVPPVAPSARFLSCLVAIGQYTATNASPPRGVNARDLRSI